MTPWHDDDSLWETMGPYLFTRERLELAAADTGGAIKLLGLVAGARILDLCCGPGRHSLELARRGFQVTGVDRTRAYIENARRRAAEESLELELVEEDMRRFRRFEAFDGAVNLFTSFGYFERPGEDLQVLRNLYASLKRGGRLVIDLMGKEVLARIYRQRDWQEMEDGTLFLQERQVRGGWAWLRVHWLLIRGSERREFTLEHRIYSGTELAALLVQAGFREVVLHGSLAGSDYDHAAERLVAVGVK